MPSEQDNLREQLRQRRREREAQRKKEELERRKLFVRLGAVGVVLILVTVLIVVITSNPGTPQPGQTTDPDRSTVDTQPPEQTEAPPETEPEPTDQPLTTTIHIAAAGDLNVTDQTVGNALGPNGYDFTDALLDVAPVLAGADLTVLNFEGTLSGTPYGGETSSAPPELIRFMAQMGVDAVQTANSASIRGGVQGLQSTIQGLQEAGITPIGTFADAAAFKKSGGYTIINVQGLRIALVAFTKGMDNLGLPEGNEKCVNLLYSDYTTDYKDVNTDGINKVLRAVREEQPDLTIAMLHWGSEYNEEISSSQQSIARLMLNGGVDIILGSHPHLVHTIDFDKEAGTLVAYSLGDLYGDATQAGANYSLILDIQVTRDNLTGETTIDGFTYTPIYILRPEQSAQGGLRTVRIEEAMSRYEDSYIGRVTEDTYDAMEYAQKRIKERIAAEMK